MTTENKVIYFIKDLLKKHDKNGSIHSVETDEIT